jgi:hypothetical protein
MVDLIGLVQLAFHNLGRNGQLPLKKYKILKQFRVSAFDLLNQGKN